jgi:hypothetical protein
MKLVNGRDSTRKFIRGVGEQQGVIRVLIADDVVQPAQS